MDKDKSLSDIYRKLSREQTSAELDQQVLEEAGKAAGGTSLRRYVRLRPLAWAATVLLSFGLLLDWQLSTEPPAPAMLDESLMVPPSSGQAGTDIRASQPNAEITGESDDADGGQRQSTPASTNPQSFIDSPGRNAVREAERMLEEKQSTDLPASEPAALRARRSAEPVPRHCAEHETADPASWYACILELERAGKDEEAASERNLLFSRFPDFEVR